MDFVSEEKNIEVFKTMIKASMKNESLDAHNNVSHTHSINKKMSGKLELWQDCYSQNKDGNTQLHTAIIKKQLDAAFVLINLAPHPCYFNIFNNRRQSVLHLAVLTRQPKVVRQLILAGADPLISFLNGNTALHFACTLGDLECVKALTELLTLSERSIFGPSKLLTCLPQNLELRNNCGDMCIHLAVEKGNIEVVRYLARLGADLESRGRLYGSTALQIAIQKKHRDIAMMLLNEFKFDVNVRNLHGDTAYTIAFQNNETQIVEKLIEVGACKPSLPKFSDDKKNNNS